MKNLISFLFCLLVVGCTSPEVVPPTSKKKYTYEPVITYSNPALISGSSFGHYFQSLYRLRLYNDMLMFTESGTVKRFGKEQILFYFKTKLKFDYELGKLTNVYHRSDTHELTYSRVQINATRRVIRIDAIVENDSCKLLLHNLNDNPFY